MAKVLSSSKLLDDRGLEFPTVRISGTQVWDGRDVSAELPKELAEACVAAVKKFPPSQWPAWPSVALGACGAICVLWLTGSRTGQALLLPTVFPLTLIAVMYARRRSSERRPYDERVLATLIAAEHCPSCGYSLGAVPPGRGGLKTCSECGASWLVPDVNSLPMRRPGVPDPIVPESELPVADRVSYPDGRGRAVWLTDPARGIVPSVWGQLSAIRQNRILQRSHARGKAERAGWTIGAVCAYVLAGLQFMLALDPARSLAVFLGLMFAVIGTLAAVKALRFRTARDGESIGRIFLAEWVCPSCCTQFTDLAEEPDGCITCPACRAAWRVKGAVAMSPGTV
jgi:hypothetical protein